MFEMMRVVAVGSSVVVVVGPVAVNLCIIFIHIVSSCNMIRCDPERVMLFSRAVLVHRVIYYYTLTNMIYPLH